MTISAPTNLPCGLHADVWGVIARNLSMTDAMSLGETCKGMNTLIQNRSSLWEKFYEDRFGAGTAQPLKGRILTLQMHLLIDGNLKKGCFYPFSMYKIQDKNVGWLKLCHNSNSNLALMYFAKNTNRGENSFSVAQISSGYTHAHFSNLQEEEPLKERYNTNKWSGIFNLHNLSCAISTAQKAIEWDPSAADLKDSSQVAPITFLAGDDKGVIYTEVLLPQFEDRGNQKFGRSIAHPGSKINCIAFADNLFYSAAAGRSLKVHDIKISVAKDGLEYRFKNDDFKGVTSEIHKLAARGGKLYAGGQSDKMHIWDTSTREYITAVSLLDAADKIAPENTEVTELYADENKLFVCYTNGREDESSLSAIKIWNLQPFEYLHKIDLIASNGWVDGWADCLTTYGPKLFSGHNMGSMNVWDIHSFEHVARFSELSKETKINSIEIKDGVLCANHEYTGEEKTQSFIQLWPLAVSSKKILKKCEKKSIQQPPYIKRIIDAVTTENKKRKRTD